MLRYNRLLVLFQVCVTLLLTGCVVVNIGQESTPTQTPNTPSTQEATLTGVVTNILAGTGTQDVTVTPDDTSTPSATGTADTTGSQSITSTPGATGTQGATSTQGVMSTPDATSTQGAASLHGATTTPDGTSTPTATVTQTTGGIFSNISVSIEPPDLSAQEIFDLAISSLIIIFAVIYGGRLVHFLLRKLTKRTQTTFDDAILEAIKPQIRLLIAAIGFQIATMRLSFLSANAGGLFETAYFILYLYVFIATIWRIIDFSLQWRLDNQDPDKDKTLSRTMTLFLGRMSHILLLILGIAAFLAYFGVSILGITAALGLTGFALSLSLKDTISNIISGIVLMIDQPFKIGDRIEIPVLDKWGDVVTIGIRSTSVVTRDNVLVVVPNSSVVDSNVTNYSRPDPSYRLQTDIGIGAEMDIHKVLQILNDAVREVYGVMKDKPVDVLFIAFGDSSNTFRVRWWVKSYTQKRSVSHRVNTAIQEAATKEGIDMPYTTFSLDNQLKINGDDIVEIAKSFKEPD